MGKELNMHLLLGLAYEMRGVNRSRADKEGWHEFTCDFKVEHGVIYALVNTKITKLKVIDKTEGESDEQTKI